MYKHTFYYFLGNKKYPEIYILQVYGNRLPCQKATYKTMHNQEHKNRNICSQVPLADHDMSFPKI